MENQKEMVEFIKWIATNVKGFEKSTPEEIVTAINGMAQSEEGKKSLQELYTQFQASKKKFQFGGIIPRMQGGGDTLRYMTLRPIVTTRNGYPEQIGEDRTISIRYSTYSPGAAPARREFYTEDGYTRRINGNDTIWLKRRPIAYTPAGNPENKEDLNYIHIWKKVMPTPWMRAMFSGKPDSVESPEFVESKQPGGRIEVNKMVGMEGDELTPRHDIPVKTKLNILSEPGKYSAHLIFPDGGSSNQWINGADTVYTQQRPSGQQITYFKKDGVWNIKHAGEDRLYSGNDVNRDVDRLRKTFDYYK